LTLSEPAVWVAGSLLAAVLATNLSWLIARKVGARATRLHAGLRPLAWLLVSAYLLLPPVGALSTGAISPYFLGLAEINWLESLAAGGLLTALIVALAAVGRAVYGRNRVAEVRFSGQLWRAPLDAVFQQWHWAFYRAGLVGWLASLVSREADIAAVLQGAISGIVFPEWAGPAALLLQLVSTKALQLLQTLLEQPLYWGSWLGLGLVAVEWSLNPFARADLRSPGCRELLLLRVALAVATTALFTLTRNLWLCLVCHVLAEALVAAMPF
jgi:hypothetical protein